MDLVYRGWSPEFGKTVGWQILQGRDFSRDIKTDEAGMIINESAAKYMALENPIGEIVMLEGHPLTNSWCCKGYGCGVAL